MTNATLKAGAASRPILFPKEMFPTDMLVGVQKNPFARALILSGSQSFAILALELVNVGDDIIEKIRRYTSEKADVPYEQVWVHVTHAITTPHAPGGPNFGKPGHTPPSRPGFAPDPNTPMKRATFEKAVLDAAIAAVDACLPLKSAVYGLGTGESLVNVNRDLEFPQGWWVKQNPAEKSNKKMQVLTVKTPDGTLIATFVSYGIKPSAIDQSGREDGTAMVSPDVPGHACALVEKELGAPCLFCMSAAGDQVPREQSFYETVDESGHVCRVDDGFARGIEIVERLGREMADDILSIVSKTDADEHSADLRSASSQIICGMRAQSNRQSAPTHELEYKLNGYMSLDMSVATLGDEIAFVAVKPETNAQTESELWKGSPYKHTMLLSMINGGMKYMPDKLSYERCTWEAGSSMLMPGAAEKWVARANDLLKTVKMGRAEPKVTVIATPYGDGERIDTAVVEFPGEVPELDKIAVVDRTILSRKLDGKTLTLELSPDDKAATVLYKFDLKPGGPGKGPGGPGGPGKGSGGPRGPVRGGKERNCVAVEVEIPGFDAPIISTKAVQNVIDDFVSGSYKRILYNLFIPKNYDPAKKYPLVLFIPDAGPNGNDPLLALAQGIGGTIWATPEEQAKHPCFVLAVQIPSGIMLTTDEHTVSDEFNDIVELLNRTIDSYSIDHNRIYTTGQSQGCMASCELMARFPDLFAAAMPISGHWDVEKMTSLTHSRFLFGLSEGGLKEYPNFNEITEGLEAKGVKVHKVRLNFRDGWEINNAKVREAIGNPKAAQVVYVIFDKDTAFPDDQKNRPPFAHHNRGWELCYYLEPARDWLFAQSKD